MKANILNNQFTSVVNAGEICLAVSLSNLGETWSGPVALCGLRWHRSFCIPSWVILTIEWYWSKFQREIIITLKKQQPSWMEGGAVGHNFERDTYKDHLCQVWTLHRCFLPSLAPQSRWDLIRTGCFVWIEMAQKLLYPFLSYIDVWNCRMWAGTQVW
jgi:hypothetical protein